MPQMMPQVMPWVMLWVMAGVMPWETPGEDWDHASSNAWVMLWVMTGLEQLFGWPLADHQMAAGDQPWNIVTSGGWSATGGSD